MTADINEEPPQAALTRSEPPPPTGREGGERGPTPVLRILVPVAALGLLALFTGRVLAPAVKGVGVGMGWLVIAVGVTGAVSSQVFAFAAMMTAVLAVVAASRSRLPVAVRIAALTLGGFAALPTMWALYQQVPELSAALISASACLLALITVPTSLRAPFARGAALVIALVALGGLVRLCAVGIAFQSTVPRFGNLVPVARAVSAAALLCDAAAVAVGMVWIASRGKRLTSPAGLAILVLALFVTRHALAGQAPDAHGLDLLCWRAAGRLMSRPDASLPLVLRIFVAVLAPLAAVGALFSRGALAPLGAGVAFALAARGAVEMPPCALMLMVGAIGVALTAHDGRALWASLGAVPSQEPER